jgi:hypothetical protein
MRSGSHVQLAALRNRDLELQTTSPFSNHGSVERSTAYCRHTFLQFLLGFSKVPVFFLSPCVCRNMVRSVPPLAVYLTSFVLSGHSSLQYSSSVHKDNETSHAGLSKSLCAPDDYNTHLSCLTTWLNRTAWQPTARARETLDSH